MADSKLTGTLTKLLLATVSLVVGLGIAEGANRLRLSMVGNPYDAEAMLTAMRQEVEHADQVSGGLAGQESSANDEAVKVREEEKQAKKDRVAWNKKLQALKPKEKKKAIQERQAAAKRERLAQLATEKKEAVANGMAHRVENPYTGFASLQTLRLTSSDAVFFRSEEAEESFDIFLFGGSVAHGFGRDASDVLIDLIKHDPRFAHRPIRFSSYATASFKQPQQLIGLAYLLSLGFRPDAVINLDGFNEVAVGNKNDHFDVHPAQPSVSQWGGFIGNVLDDETLIAGMLDLRVLRLRNDAIAQRALDSGLLWSSLVGNYFNGRLMEGRSQEAPMQKALLTHLAGKGGRNLPDMKKNAVIQGPTWVRGLEQVMGLCVGVWKEASISMDAMCDRRSIFYLHVLQPTLYSEGAKVATELELKKGKASKEWTDGVQVGYPKLREAGRQLQTEGVEFLDAALVFADVSETLYYDPCHFKKEGQAILAEYVAAAFLERYPAE